MTTGKGTDEQDGTEFLGEEREGEPIDSPTRKNPPTKSEVKKALGKDPDAPPSTGRLKKGATVTKKIHIDAPKLDTFKTVIIGTAPLVLHAWSLKSVREMLQKQQNPKMTKKQQKELRIAKNPFEDFKGSLTCDPDGNLAIDSRSPKAAMLASCRHIPDVTMSNLKMAVRVLGEYCPLFGQPKIRYDMVRVGIPPNTTADIRFRGELKQWAALLTFQIIPSLIEAQSVHHLLDWAGGICGIAENRPERGGTWGTFRIGTLEELKDLGLKRWNIADVTEENSGADVLLAELTGLLDAEDDEEEEDEEAAPASNGARI